MSEQSVKNKLIANEENIIRTQELENYLQLTDDYWLWEEKENELVRMF